MSEDDKAFLDEVYDVDDAAGTKLLYRDWAAGYEAEVKANGYITPTRCAEAMAGLVADLNAPILDLGCGTGLSGEALKAAGFTVIDGSDFSQEMLAYAREKPNLYRNLTLSNLENPLPAQPGDYSNIAAIGVFSPNHAPASVLDRSLEQLPVGGCLVFSLNDHALVDSSYEDRVKALEAEGQAEVAFKEYGAHLPAREIKAMVYILRNLGQP